jgi:hypothetical protein
MTHDAHTGLSGYDERQILHDGCAECESRSADCLNTLGWMDRSTFVRAWTRAYRWQCGDKTVELGPLSEVEQPVLHMLWAIQVALERFGVPLGTLPPPNDLFLDLFSETARLSVIASKAKGLIRTSNHARGDDLRVVQQWWDALEESLWCEGGNCGPVVDATDDEFDPSVLGPRPDEIPPHQFTYCSRCGRGWRWDVALQRLVPWP